MQQYTIGLPTAYISESKAKQIIHQIAKTFGGITVLNGESKNIYGLWINDNDVMICDNHIMLIINTDKESLIKTLKSKLEIELNEDWIYITKHNVQVIK